MEIMLTAILVLQIVSLLIVIAAYHDTIPVLFRTLFGKKNKAVQNANSGANPSKYRNLNNKSLFKTVLADIGGNVSEELEDGRLVVDYQGEHFMVDAPEDRNFIVMFDTWWHDIDVHNLEQFSVMREAINTVNMTLHSSSIMYSVDENEGRAGVHCKAVFPLNAHIPALQSYLKYYFSDILSVHQSFYRATEEIRQRQTESKEKV